MSSARCTPSQRCAGRGLGHSFVAACVHPWRLMTGSCSSPAIVLPRLRRLFHYLAYPSIRPPSAPRLRRACCTPRRRGHRSRHVGLHRHCTPRRAFCTAPLAPRTSLIAPCTVRHAPRAVASQPTSHVAQEPEPKLSHPDPAAPGPDLSSNPNPPPPPPPPHPRRRHCHCPTRLLIDLHLLTAPPYRRASW